jgi:hypothetical protein
LVEENADLEQMILKGFILTSFIGNSDTKINTNKSILRSYYYNKNDDLTLHKELVIEEILESKEKLMIILDGIEDEIF